MLRAADLVPLPGVKKAPKKRIAAILEPSDDSLAGENGDALAENDEENSSDTEDLGKCYIVILLMSPCSFCITCRVLCSTVICSYLGHTYE